MLGDDRVQDYVQRVPGTDPEQFRQRLSIGDRCYAAWLQDEVVAVRWAAFRDVQVTRQGLMLSVGEAGAYLYGAYTAPSWRRRGIGAALTAHLLDHLESEGRQRALSAWIPENAEARSLNPSRGQPLAVVGVVRVGRWQRQLRPRPAAARRPLLSACLHPPLCAGSRRALDDALGRHGRAVLGRKVLDLRRLV